MLAMTWTNYVTRKAILAITVLLVVLLGVTYTAKAHAVEEFVDWNIAKQYVEFPQPPKLILLKPGASTDIIGNPWHATIIVKGPYEVHEFKLPGEEHVINMNTGDIFIVNYLVRYVNPSESRLDFIVINRVGFTYALLGKYVNGTFIGVTPVVARPGYLYNVTLVLRAIYPGEYHLHPVVAVQGIGNIPAYTSDPRDWVLIGGHSVPLLYAVFTSASGPVVEPLQGIQIPETQSLGLSYLPILNFPWLPPLVAIEFIVTILALIGFILYGRRVRGG